jgi:hypothetical protein
VTQEQIQAVQQSDEPETAAMEFVNAGIATLIEFSSSNISGYCGKEERFLEPCSAASVGGWEYVFGCLKWGDYEGDLLYSNEDSLIVPGTMKEEAVEGIIDTMKSALDTVEKDDDLEHNARPT